MRDCIVSATDELFESTGHEYRMRTLGDYKSTNAPLSAAEIARAEQRDQGQCRWTPRTAANIGDMAPIPERSPN